jgi:hypothetical protein
VTDFKDEKSPSVSATLPPSVVRVLLRVGIAFRIGAAQTGSGLADSAMTEDAPELDGEVIDEHPTPAQIA